jgi:tripartite-type tricarboxylate transporter receptor subunit TctC
LRIIISEALNSPELADRIDSAGAAKIDTNPEQSQEFFQREIKYWGEVVKSTKLNL